jgi:hypothetical protein
MDTKDLPEKEYGNGEFDHNITTMVHEKSIMKLPMVIIKLILYEQYFLI